MKTFHLTPRNAAAWTGALALLGFGCGQQHDHPSPAQGGHSHGSAHGGVAVELGDHQYHLDFLADPGVGALKAWVMDAHADEFIRITNSSVTLRVSVQGSEKDLDLAATANSTTGETVGDTSQFEARADWLKGVDRFTAVVPSVRIRGQTFTNVSFSYPAH